MKLYHGTKTEKADAIEQEGFYGSELSEFTTNGNSQDTREGVVFCATTVEEAREYGDAIFEIDAEDGEMVAFQESPITGEMEYYITAALLNDEIPFERIS
jgi:hypothetical protein